jgi:hypothetical protein
MTFTMHHGVTLHTGTAVQEVSVKYTKQLSKVEGMVSGKTQTLAAYEFGDENTGSVKGKGDVTISPGLASAGLISGTLSGGLTHIGEVSVKEALRGEAEWEYTFTHMPHAA